MHMDHGPRTTDHGGASRARRALALVALAAVAASGAASAQTNLSGVRLGGLGRAVVTNQRLAGDALDGDTLNDRRSAGGYSLLDLAIEAEPNADTEARVVLRVRTDLGGFFGDGYRFGIRELYVRGTIADAFTYSVGDTDLRLTPYTVHSTPETAVNEAAVFGIRRDVVRYETYQYGAETWRLQGLRTGVGLAFDRGVDRVRLEAFLARTAPTTGTVPDRLLGGGRAAVEVSRALTLGATFVDLFDLEGTGSADGLATPVLTGDLRAALDVPGLGEVGVRAEAGASRATFGDESAVPVREDFFVDAGLFATVGGVALAAGYRDVGPEFVSPAAQTRRLPYGQTPDLFPVARGFEGARALTQLDALTQDELYTNRIRAGLLPYDPRLDPAEPYGRATPNRRGLSLHAGWGDALPDTPAADLPPVELRAGLDLLSEIVGEGTAATRSFTVARGAADVRLARLGLFPGTLTLGVQHAVTDRDDAPFQIVQPDGTTALADTGAVDLTSTLFNAGITAPLVGRLDGMLGVKVLAASGNEVRALRDDPADPFAISGFEPLAYDGAETLLGAGLRYRIRDANSLSAQVALLRVSDGMRDAGSYRIADLFLHYVLTF